MNAILPGFYEADRLEQVAINLFYGWGYNFYRAENQIRADDQLIRGHVVALLGAARECVAAAEGAWRRERLPPPSREKPRPDPEAIAGAQRLERLSAAIGALIGQLTAQPVPEGDRMTQRYRDEGDTLAKLIACDKPLVGQAEILRATLDSETDVWMVANAEAIEAAIGAIRNALRARQEALL